jgi:hypothetical protein
MQMYCTFVLFVNQHFLGLSASGTHCIKYKCSTDILNKNFSVTIGDILQMELLQDFYETTLEALKDAKNDRLWFKTNTKLGKLYFDRSDFNKLAKILKQLHQSCQVGTATPCHLTSVNVRCLCSLDSVCVCMCVCL